ncbi:MAG TPA: membrane-bound O-acyltransferase family protein [Cyanobacteria bacterium UBA8803]|nr:membrane-bound O-acyltransferase family protein [Cyanobacteria bacterium UBA9273]HBL58558.1 membrane-bound O-acyltransferase family protein [Cyanobacteria bacterium UBA8803]
MLFNSYPFIFVFLPVTLIVFFGLTKFRLTTAATAWLLIVSLVFYGYWNIFYLPLMLMSIAFNYLIGRAIETSKLGSPKAKSLLWLGIGVNLILLGYYKYANFFITSFDAIANTDWTIPPIILPIGISFYTFTQTAYLVDAYRGETKKQNLLTYALFVTFFPHLIAGPILHHKEMIPQFHRLRNFVFSHKNIARGLVLFGLGLAKKVLIADNISPWVAPVFNNADSVSFIEAWVGALSYTFQLYFDFSGYCDMAIGLGWMINIDLPINFDSPYKARSISEFWRRWHITLSNFLRDYLYIPLGGNRKGEIRRYANLLITMLLGGLWHGAGWTYVAWGGLHGLYLCINHGWRKAGLSLPKLLAWAVTFLAVVVGWVLFRSHTFSEAMELLKAMVGMKGIVLPGEPQGKLSVLTQLGLQLKSWKDLVYLPEVNGSKALSIVVLVALMLCSTLLPNTQQILQRFKPNWWWALGVGVLTSFCLLSLNRISEFLYFQF